jgi:hypothetical protein
MNTATETELVPAACKRCGQGFYYEPIRVWGNDLGKLLHVFCDACKASERDAEHVAGVEKRRHEIEERIRATIDPALVETNVRHPDFDPDLWLAVSEWRPTRDARWLGIIGPAGICKTRCMALYAMRVMRSGTRICWTTANRLYEAAGDRKNRLEGVAAMARDHLADCLRAPWLFLDDFGKNEWNAAFESQLFQILDHRKNHFLPTVYSSNAHPEEFSQVISAFNARPIIGRMLENTTILNLTA